MYKKTSNTLFQKKTKPNHTFQRTGTKPLQNTPFKKKVPQKPCKPLFQKKTYKNSKHNFQIAQKPS